MSAVNITNVAALDNPTAFLNPFQFEISYECLVPLDDGTDRLPSFFFGPRDAWWRARASCVLRSAGVVLDAVWSRGYWVMGLGFATSAAWGQEGMRVERRCIGCIPMRWF